MLIKKIMSKKLKNFVYPLVLSCLALGILSFQFSKVNRAPMTSFSHSNPNYDVHVFYYGGYRNLEVDNRNQGWNYNDGYLKNSINDTFYPALGLYSSNNKTIIDLHMKQIREADIGVVVVEWWPNQYDKMPDLSVIFRYAAKYDLKVTVQIREYPDRNLINLRQNLGIFFKKYRKHPSLYWYTHKSKRLPMIYIHKFHDLSLYDWNKLLGFANRMSLRNTSMDAFYIGHISEDFHKNVVMHSSFDGFYTYSPLLFDGSDLTWTRWPYLQDFANDYKLIFIPTVCPGSKFMLTKNPDKRIAGEYYSTSWFRAVVSRASIVSINSFNGWYESTQIESAQPFKMNNLTFADYLPHGPNYYLSLTRDWIYKFENRPHKKSMNTL